MKVKMNIEVECICGITESILHETVENPLDNTLTDTINRTMQFKALGYPEGMFITCKCGNEWFFAV